MPFHDLVHIRNRRQIHLLQFDELITKIFSFSVSRPFIGKQTAKTEGKVNVVREREERDKPGSIEEANLRRDGVGPAERKLGFGS